MTSYGWLVTANNGLVVEPLTDVVEVRGLDRIPIPGGEPSASPVIGEHGDLATGATST